MFCRARENETSTEVCSDGPMAKKHAGGKKVVDKKKKDKKKTLKRLWYWLHYEIVQRNKDITVLGSW